MKITIVFNVLLMAVTPLMALISSCKDDQPWDELPVDISHFISQYFPNSGIESFTTSPTTYHIRISNGPGLTFDKDGDWETINGYGMPLPEVLLYDQLPPALYKYLEETSNLGNVFAIERNSRIYTVVLLDSTITYTIADQQITGAAATASAARRA